MVKQERATLSLLPDKPAKGVHDHPEFKTGACPPVKTRSRLKLGEFLKITNLPPVPESLDDMKDIEFALDNNNRFGVCVPTGFDNLRRLVTQLLTGSRIDASWEDILAWYRSQNPDFDPANYSEKADGGLVIQYFLEWLVKQGLILGFAEVDWKNEEELRAALYLFLGLLAGVDLKASQQSQTQQGYWDNVPGSEDWGGHCVMLGAYEPGGYDVESWLRRIRLTENFRTNQITECWIVILPDHISHPSFRQGFDLEKFAEAYTEITGRPFPVQIQPEEQPPANALSFQVNDPELLHHINTAIDRTHKGNPQGWLTDHFRSYFKIKK